MRNDLGVWHEDDVAVELVPAESEVLFPTFLGPSPWFFRRLFFPPLLFSFLPFFTFPPSPSSPLPSLSPPGWSLASHNNVSADAAARTLLLQGREVCDGPASASREKGVTDGTI